MNTENIIDYSFLDNCYFYMNVQYYKFSELIATNIY